VNKLRDAVTLKTGKTVSEFAQTLQVREQTHDRCKSKSGGMTAEEAKRLKELEVNIARPEKLLAEAELDMAMLKELQRNLPTYGCETSVLDDEAC